MVDDSGEGGSNAESSSQTIPGQNEWETFDEPENELVIPNVLPEEKPPKGNGRYLSGLGEFKTNLLFITTVTAIYMFFGIA